MSYEADLDKAIREGKQTRERVKQFHDNWEAMRTSHALAPLARAAELLRGHGIESDSGNRNGYMFLASDTSELTFKFDRSSCSIVCTMTIDGVPSAESYDHESFEPRVIKEKAVAFSRRVASLL